MLYYCILLTDTDFFWTAAGAKSPSGSSGRRVSCKLRAFLVYHCSSDLSELCSRSAWVPQGTNWKTYFFSYKLECLAQRDLCSPHNLSWTTALLVKLKLFLFIYLIHVKWSQLNDVALLCFADSKHWSCTSQWGVVSSLEDVYTLWYW